jgi:hypothetical protein
MYTPTQSPMEQLLARAVEDIPAGHTSYQLDDEHNKYLLTQFATEGGYVVRIAEYKTEEERPPTTIDISGHEELTKSGYILTARFGGGVALRASGDIIRHGRPGDEKGSRFHVNQTSAATLIHKVLTGYSEQTRRQT